jgi:acyl carrier protein
MVYEEIKQKTKQLILQVLPSVSDQDLADDTDVFGLGLDSINAMSLIYNVQDTFDIRLETSEINFENFQSVATIVEMIERKQAAVEMKQISNY